MSILKLHTLGLAAIMAIAGNGLMQGAEHGTFHLTAQTFWGPVLLQPGDYSVYLPDASLGEVTLRVQGNGKTVFELPMLATTGKFSDSNYLKLADVGGNYFVTEFAAGPLGKTFEFHAPKLSARQQEAAGTGMMLNVLVK